MGAKSNYLENKLTDFLWRQQAFVPPSIVYPALIVATRGYSNSIRSTVVSLGDTVIPATPNGRIYKCTTGGTTGSGEPTWPVTAGGTVADGTAVWTEQTIDLEAGTFTEPSGGSYARPAVACSLANWSGTQGAGTTTASTGTGGTTGNNNPIAYPAPTAPWGVIFGFYLMDALTGGNSLEYAPLAIPKTVNGGDPAPSFAAGAMTLQEDN